MIPIVKPPACCTCPIFGRLCDPLNPNIPGPVPGFFGFGMLVSAHILCPVSPGLGVGGPIRANVCGTVCGPFGAVLRPRADQCRADIPGRLLARLADQWPGRFGGSIAPRGGPMGPGLRPIRAHAARLPNVPGAWVDGMPGRMDRRVPFHAKHEKPLASR